MNLKRLFQTNTLYMLLFSGTVQADKFTTRVVNPLLNKPFKSLTASAWNDNALEHLLIVDTYSLL